MEKDEKRCENCIFFMDDGEVDDWDGRCDNTESENYNKTMDHRESCDEIHIIVEPR